MTKILVLGNSMAGALRMARNRFAELVPDVEIGFFAAPGGSFIRGRVDRRCHFVPHTVGPSAVKALIQTINDGSDSVDLTPWDHILVVGLRPQFTATNAFLRSADIVEGGRTGKDMLISEALLAEAIRELVNRFVRTVAHKYRLGLPLTFTAAPYPSEGIVERTDHSLAAPVAFYRDHPETPRVFAHWEAALATAWQARGYRYLSQPQSTLAGPALTRSIYAETAADGSGKTLPRVDHRHMNGEFGLAMLLAYARSLGLAVPDMSDHSAEAVAGGVA